MKGRGMNDNNPAIRSLLTVICTALLAVVLLCLIFFRQTDFIDLEKRYREKWPEFTSGNFLNGEWGRQVDAWISDNMPARELLTGINAYFTYATGRQPAQDIITDKTGRLLESPTKYAEADLSRRLAKISTFAETQKNGALLIVPPTAGYSSKTSLPGHVWRCYRDDEIFGAVISEAARVYTCEGFDAVGATAGNVAVETAAGSGLGFVDLREQFMNASAPYFYRTDHHWNGAGVYAAYSAVCNALDITPLFSDKYSITGFGGFFGANYALGGLWLTRPDDIELWAPPCVARVTISDSVSIGDGGELRLDGESVYDSLFFEERLKERDMYPVFLDGNHALTIIENLSFGVDAGAAGDTFGKATGLLNDIAADETNDEIAGGLAADTKGEPNACGENTLLVVKDSYGNSLVPLLVPHFKTIYMVDLRYFRAPVSDLTTAIGYHEAEMPALFVYSANHIVNDPDIIWLR